MTKRRERVRHDEARHHPVRRQPVGPGDELRQIRLNPVEADVVKREEGFRTNGRLRQVTREAVIQERVGDISRESMLIIDAKVLRQIFAIARSQGWDVARDIELTPVQGIELRDILRSRELGFIDPNKNEQLEQFIGFLGRGCGMRVSFRDALESRASAGETLSARQAGGRR